MSFRVISYTIVILFGLSALVTVRALAIISTKHQVSDGTLIEVKKAVHTITSASAIKPSPHPIVFIHGSYHGSWCFAEKYMPYFYNLGHDCYSISLRGSHASPVIPSVTDKNDKKILIEQHVSDVKHIIRTVNTNSLTNLCPIIVSHSFGGLITMKLLQDSAIRGKIDGAAFLCSVPPSGNGPMTNRFLLTRFIACFKIIYGFVLKAVTYNSQLCKELFFDESMNDADLKRYMEYFKLDSTVGLDLISLKKSLPSLTAVPSISTTGRNIGVAQWVADSLSDSSKIPSRLVIGAKNDYIVDEEGVIETGNYLGAEPILLDNTAHDLMLTSNYLDSATHIKKWIDSIHK